MIKIFLLFISCYGTIVLSVRTTFDASQCHLDLTCQNGPQIMDKIEGVTNAIQGRPGKSGPRGPRGMKGEKGDGCRCSQNREENSETICPQTRYLFPDEKQTTNYIRVKKPIPQLSQATICAWITPPSGEFTMGVFSYATTTHSNALLLYIKNNALKLYLRNAEREYEISITGRTHFCVTIDQPKTIVYINGSVRAITYANTNPIEGGGILLIGQEQDSLLGGFVSKEAFRGTLENMMVWYRKLSAVEITNLRRDPCACPRDWKIALTPDVVEMEGKVVAQHMNSC